MARIIRRTKIGRTRPHQVNILVQRKPDIVRIGLKKFKEIGQLFAQKKHNENTSNPLI